MSSFVIVTALVSVIQLFLGVAVGFWLKERQSPGKGMLDVERAEMLLGRLRDLAQSIKHDVGEHASQMDGISRELNTAASSPTALAETVLLQAVSQIVQANQRLVRKLATAEVKLQEQSRQLEIHVSEARVDSLTGLPNRRAYDEEMNRRLAEWQRTGHPLSLLMIDVDRFKSINDGYGHEVGDRALRHLGEVMTKTVREMDLVTRFAGEEFAVILPATNLAAGRVAAERIRKAVEQSELSLDRDAERLRMTVSIGLTEARPGDTVQTVFRRADQALYAAKHAGRNRSFMHDGVDCTLIELPATPPGADLKRPAPPRPAPPRSVLEEAPDPSAAHHPNDVRIDALTGLPNRRSFSDDLRRRVAESRRTGLPLSLMLVGIEHLDRLNAFLGQQAIDDVVLRVSQIVQAAVRETDVVTRFGWEKFAVILPATSDEEGLRVEQRMHRALAGSSLARESMPQITVQTGVGQLAAEEDSVGFAKRIDSLLRSNTDQGLKTTHLPQRRPGMAVAAGFSPTPAAAAPQQLGPQLPDIEAVGSV